MGFSSMSDNLTNTVKTRPPLVVFTVCLLGIIVTTFSLAYYVQSRDDIENSDQKINWLSIVDYLNEMSICIEKPSRFITKSVNPVIDYKNVTMLATVKVPAESQPKFLTGFISLNDWAKRCPSDTITPDYLEVDFILPKNDLKKPFVHDVCVTIKGPAYFMPIVTKPSVCNTSTTNEEIIKELPRSAVNFDKPSAIFCPTSQGNISVLKFDSKSSVLTSNEYLSREDQLRINSHLIITSCFLIAIVVLITCFALFNKRHTSNDSKTLLSKGIYI